MNASRLQEIITDPSSDISDVEKYLSDNYGKITNSKVPWDGKETRHEVLCKVFAYLAKKDANLNAFIENFPSGATLKEKLFVAVTGEISKCGLGNDRPYVDRLYRYGMCRSFCECQIAKKQSTIVQRYGVNNIMELSSVREKVAKTNIERHGGVSPMSNAVVQAKGKATVLDRYGVDNVFKRADFQETANETRIERYGVRNPAQHPAFAKKMRDTNEARYGHHSFNKSKMSPEAMSVIDCPNELAGCITERGIHGSAAWLGVDPTTIYNYVVKYNLDLGKGSSYETEIKGFLSGIGVNFLHGARRIIAPYELDFYIESHGVAIEINGVYWHSDRLKDDVNYHLMKYQRCHDLGIRLLQINEDEWVERPELIKNKIRNLLKMNIRGDAARKLVVSKIDNVIAHVFVDKYHIQGRTGYATCSYGAFDSSGELVSVMQFNKQRGTGVVELIRFCSDYQSHAGVFSKLLKGSLASEGFSEIISFADRRYSEGDVYEKNGFEKVAVVPVDYRYVKGISTFHKSSFTKAKIAKKFNIDVTGRTERELMSSLGYSRIYDCGKIKYRLRSE
jgi:very-short-patch-repair endonuclease